MAISKDFADYCCELLSGVGTPVPKRMFGGWGISVEGVTIAVIASSFYTSYQERKRKREVALAYSDANQ